MLQPNNTSPEAQVRITRVTAFVVKDSASIFVTEDWRSFRNFRFSFQDLCVVCSI